MGLSTTGRRNLDGGLPAPKTCRLIPAEPGLLWTARCTKPRTESAFSTPCLHDDLRPTRERAIEAHREHVRAEHPEAAR